MTTTNVWKHKGVKYIFWGWTGFIAENLILSHNRSEIIDQIGESKYHQIYNTLSSVACGSIAYGYLRYGRKNGPLMKVVWPRIGNAMNGRVTKTIGVGLRVLGLIGFSQLLPKLQIPWIRVPPTQPLLSPIPATPTADMTLGTVTSGGVISPTPPLYKARCPMDFSSNKDPDAIEGMKRITRHPMLYSFGIFSLSFALTTPFVTHFIMYSMPFAFSVIGSLHQDYRYRRGRGGELSKEKEDVTSNVPFGAIIVGKQKWEDIWNEGKGINAILAGLIALGLSFF